MQERRFTGSQILDYILDENEAEDTEQHSDMDEQVSEAEDEVEYQPEYTDKSDEEATSAVPAETFKSKSGKICWSSEPPDLHGRAAAADVIKMTPGSQGLL